MSDIQKDEYIPTIDAILSVVDLEKVSVKNIRGAIQELFSIDLSPNKKSINELILERYYKLQEEKSSSDQDEIARRAEMERQDALLALKLLQGGSKRAITRSNNTVKPKKVKRKRNTDSPNKPPSNTGFNKEMILSPGLAGFLGMEKCSRPQVVKALWKYIKDNSLQDPKDGRNIICDDKLETLFKKKNISAFGMNRDLSLHLFKDEDVTPAAHNGDSTKQHNGNGRGSGGVKIEESSSESEEDE